MDTKLCSACSRELPTLEFGRRGNSLQPYCKECNKVISRRYYEKNKEKHIQTARANTKKFVDTYTGWKSTLQCQVCGESHTKCLDFHHLDPSHKDFHPAAGVAITGRTKLINELLKCAVVCKNCHVKVHDGIIDSDSLRALTAEEIQL